MQEIFTSVYFRVGHQLGEIIHFSDYEWPPIIPAIGDWIDCRGFYENGSAVWIAGRITDRRILKSVGWHCILIIDLEWAV